MCWAVLVFFVFVIVLLLQKPDTARALAFTPIWFVILGIGWLFDRHHAIHDDSIMNSSDASSKN